MSDSGVVSGQEGWPVAEPEGYPDLAPPDLVSSEHSVQQYGTWSSVASAATADSPIVDQVGRPTPRVIRSPRDAEEAAADWCRWLGFADAVLTGGGSDGGVDVRALSLVAQVKAHMVPIGRPELQKLYGVAMAERALPIFFSLMAYTREAQQWADQVGMALFRFNHAGEAEPVNGYAAALFDRAGQHERRPAAPPPPKWSLPIGCPDQTAYERLLPRRSGFRQIDQLLWIRQGWLPFAGLRYDFSYLAQSGRRYEQRFAQTRAPIELVTGRVIFVPQSSGSMVLIPAEQKVIEPKWTSAELASEVSKLFGSYETGLPAASRRNWSSLSGYGVPGAATTLRVIDEGTFLLPYFAALISSQGGNRVAVLEAVTGQLHSVLSEVFTRYAPYLLDALYAGRPIGPSRQATT